MRRGGGKAVLLSTSTIHGAPPEDGWVADSLLVWVKGMAEEGGIRVWVCYRLPDQVDEAPYKQIGTMP